METSVNTKGLNSATKPKIAAASSKLVTARSNLGGLAMPDNFSKASQLNNIQKRISQVEKNLAGIIGYINNKIEDFEEAERRAAEAVARVRKMSYEVEVGGRYYVEEGDIKTQYPGRDGIVTIREKYLKDKYPGLPAPDPNSPNPLNVRREDPNNSAYEQTGSKVTEKNNNSDQPILFQWAEWVRDKTNNFDIKKTMKDAEKAYNGAVEGLEQKAGGLWNKIKNFDLKKTAATVGNMKSEDFINLLIGGGKGAAKVGEEISDAYQIMSTNSFENNPDVIYYYDGDKDKIQYGQKLLEKDTMAMVSVQHVENTYNDFYTKTELGKSLAENAQDDFKPGGKYVNWVETRAHQATIFTVGGAAGPLGVGVLGGMAAKGKAAETMWVNNDVQSLIDSGVDIDTLHNIYKTADKYSSAIGLYTGASMAFQKATGSGGKIDSVLDNPIKLILADAVVGSTEPIVNSWAESTATGASFKEIFEKNGGWNAVGAAFAGAGFDSAVGETKKWFISKGNDKIRDATGVDLLYEKARIQAELKNAAKNAVDDIIHPKDRIIADPGLYEAIDDLGNSIRNLFNRNKNTNTSTDERTRIIDQAILATMRKYGQDPNSTELWQQYKNRINSGDFSVITGDGGARQAAYNAFYRINGNEGYVSEQRNISQSDVNRATLKSDILSKSHQFNDEALKAKTIYEELNKKVHYDMNYQIGDNDEKYQILNQNMNIDNLPKNNEVVCKGWSEVYCNLLQEEGINARVVKANNGNHWWVEMDLKDGRIITADATDVIDGSIDLINSKTGKQANGFMFINENQRGIRPATINKTEAQKQYIEGIDKTLGYADNNGYKFDQMSKVDETFVSKFFDKITGKDKKAKEREIIQNAVIPNDMDGYEAFGYYKNLNDTMDENSRIPNALLYRETASGREIVNRIHTDEYVQYYSKGLGTVRIDKNQTNASFEYEKKLGIKPLPRR